MAYYATSRFKVEYRMGCMKSCTFFLSGVSVRVGNACGQRPFHRKSLPLCAAKKLTDGSPVHEWHPCGCRSRRLRRVKAVMLPGALSTQIRIAGGEPFQTGRPP